MEKTTDSIKKSLTSLANQTTKPMQLYYQLLTRTLGTFHSTFSVLVEQQQQPPGMGTSTHH